MQTHNVAKQFFTLISTETVDCRAPLSSKVCHNPVGSARTSAYKSVLTKKAMTIIMCNKDLICMGCSCDSIRLDSLSCSSAPAPMPKRVDPKFGRCVNRSKRPMGSLKTGSTISAARDPFPSLNPLRSSPVHAAQSRPCSFAETDRRALIRRLIASGLGLRIGMDRIDPI